MVGEDLFDEHAIPRCNRTCLYIGAHIIRDCLIIIDNNVSTGKAVFLSYLLWHYLERELPAVIHDITGKNICIFDQRSAGIPASPQSASSLGRYVGPHRDRFDARRFNLVGGMYRRTMSVRLGALEYSL